MGAVSYLILLVLLGLISGAFARLVLPGRDRMTIMQTLALGLAGSLIAGVIVLIVWGGGVPGLILSVACSTVILYFIRRSQGGGLSRPTGSE